MPPSTPFSARTRSLYCILALVLFLLFLIYDSIVPTAPPPLSISSTHPIANATLGFQKLLVINAPWRTDRRDSISLAASYTGLSVTWIAGVNASDIAEKAYPPGSHRALSEGNRGSWRAHMDAIREIIRQNLSTALILEDDADWDFRLRSQLHAFSHAARRIPSLAAQAELHAQKQARKQNDASLTPVDLAKLSTLALLKPSPRDKVLHDHPYGRDWHILWLGHCGAELPPPSPQNPDRLMLLDDETVPEPQHLKPMSRAPLDQIATLYPPHTRVVHRTNATVCTLAYAVTQAGARRLLYEFGIREFSKGYDFALSDYCNGLTRGATRATMPMCVTLNPPIFSHFFSRTGASDIAGVGAGGREVGTRYVKLSVRGNLEGLVRGEEGILEQWEDENHA